jgi:hypothetical protein
MVANVTHDIEAERAAVAVAQAEAAAAQAEAAQALADARAQVEQLQADTYAAMANVHDGAPGERGEPGPPGSIAGNWRGEWSITEIYQQHDTTRTADGATWLALGLTHDFPTDDDPNWRLLIPAPEKGAGFRWLGEFVRGMAIEPGDVVRGDAGAAWVWIGNAGFAQELPGDGWQLMVKQGATGGRGKPGEQGRPGVGIETIAGGLNCLVFALTDGRVITVPFGEGDA